MRKLEVWRTGEDLPKQGELLMMVGDDATVELNPDGTIGKFGNIVIMKNVTAEIMDKPTLEVIPLHSPANEVTKPSFDVPEDVKT